MPNPPDFWAASYRELAREHGLGWTTLDKLMRAVRAFLDPVLAGTTGRWDRSAWTWRAEQGEVEPENAENDPITPRGEDR